MTGKIRWGAATGARLISLSIIAVLALALPATSGADEAEPKKTLFRAKLDIGPTQDVVWERGPEAPPAGDRPPNIILILVDDLGFNDISLNGGGVANGRVQTPNIDSIGRNGITFTEAYTGHPNCAPSRASIMTGRYPTRSGFAFTPTPLAFARKLGTFETQGREQIYRADLESQVPSVEEMGLPVEEITLAEVLGEAGYHTVQLGKWHLGEAAAFQPNNQGFDEHLGFYGGGIAVSAKGRSRRRQFRSGLRSDRSLSVGPASVLRSQQ